MARKRMYFDPPPKKRRQTDVVTRAVQQNARKRGVKVYEDGSFVTKGGHFDPDTGTVRDRKR